MAQVGTVAAPLATARRMAASILGPSPLRNPPERVLRTIREQETSSEILICFMQIAAILFFALLYWLSPKGFSADVKFMPVPIALAAYGLFTGVRLALAWRGQLTNGFVAVSVVVDVAVLMVTIWSFHLQYDAAPAIYLKAPTLLYIFIIIALRALRFDPRWVLLAGVTAAAGWLVLLAYALWGQPMSAMVTHSYAEYATSTKLLIGAEIDKIVSILVVTALLTLALVRGRRTLLRSVAEEAAAAELSRFFAPDIAATIRDAGERIEPGSGIERQAAVMFIDLRGFTTLASRLEPTAIVRMLGQYHGIVLPIVARHNGSVITYLGDGIMITFGATRLTATCAADALRAAEALIEALDIWAGASSTSDGPALKAGIGVAFGTVVFGAIGTEGRLEYATIGDPVNRAARLQGQTKAEAVTVLASDAAWAAAIAQGYTPARSCEPRICRLAGIQEPVNVMAVR